MYRVIWVLLCTAGALCAIGVYRGFEDIAIFLAGITFGIVLVGELLLFKFGRQENGRRR